ETPTSGGDEATPSYAKDVDLISLDHASLNRVWDGFVTYVRQKKVALGVCLISGRLKSFDDGAFTIDFSKSLSFQRDQVERATNRKFLKGMMSKYFGRDLELVCVSGEREANGEQRGSSVVPGSGDAASGARPIDAKPIVKKILSDFDGEIIRYHPQ
ncbi:MAG: hypothetical protein OEN01_08795, partial [Candidatus Krumholzibacteria bacterium]|nr:hypothetical protein [Candidatus Krumholzibacteria bacterium]